MVLIECFTSCHIDNIAACLRLQPDQLVLVGDGPAMSDAVGRYRKLLKQRGQRTQIALCDVAGKDLPGICAALLDLIREDEDYVIDMTGGEELVIMAVGALLALLDSPQHRHIRVEKYDWKCGAVRDCIHDNRVLPGKPVELSVEELVMLHGGTLHPRAQQLPSHSSLAQIEALWQMASAAPRDWNRDIRLLGEFESRADSKMQVYLPLRYLRSSIPDFSSKEPQMRQLLRKLHSCGVISDSSSDRALEYTYSSALMRYCTLKAGNVLEVKTLLEGQAVLENGAPFFRHSSMGVSIDWDGVLHPSSEGLAETRNEIDVLLMHGMTPLFISCKNGSVDEGELYKLNAVAQYFGGPYAKKMLIATQMDRDRPAANRAFAQRAWDMDIFFVTDASDLSHEEWRQCFQRAVD